MHLNSYYPYFVGYDTALIAMLATPKWWYPHLWKHHTKKQVLHPWQYHLSMDISIVYFSWSVKLGTSPISWCSAAYVWEYGKYKGLHFSVEHQ